MPDIQKRPAGQEAGLKNIISFTDNNIKKNVKSQEDLITKLFNKDDILKQYYKLNLSIKEIKKTIDNIDPMLRQAVGSILFKNYLKTSQFQKESTENIIIELATENIVIYSKNDGKIERIKDINTVKSYIATKYKIDAEYIKIKKYDIPTRKLVFDQLNLTKDDEINIYKESEIKRQAREKAHKSNKKIDIDEFLKLIEKDCKAIYILLSNLFQDNFNKKYFLNWLAYIVGTGQKTRNAVVLRGVQGSGKNLFFENIIRPFFGENWTNTVGAETIESVYNANIENKLFIAFNEIQNYENRTKVSDKLKQIISDDFITINEKFIKIRTVRNIANCIFFSNSATPISIEGSDRRYSIFTANIPLKDKVSNINKLIADMKSEIVDFYAYLLSLNYIEDFAKNVLQNNERELIKKTTTNFTDLIGDLLAQGLTDKFIEYIDEELNESSEEDKTYVDIAKEQLKNGYLSTELLYAIYLQVNNLIEPGRTGNNEEDLKDKIDFKESLNRLKIMQKKAFVRKISIKIARQTEGKKESGKYIYVWKFDKKTENV
jgi:hypothetical protein